MGVFNFWSCDGLTDAGLAFLGGNLPASLLKLELNLEQCTSIGDSGISALAQGLPVGLEKLLLNLNSLWCLGDPGALALAQNLPVSLQVLSLRVERTGVSRATSNACKSLASMRAWANTCDELPAEPAPLVHKVARPAKP